jgi:hypothetical protein
LNGRFRGEADNDQNRRKSGQAVAITSPTFFAARGFTPIRDMRVMAACLMLRKFLMGGTHDL